MKKLLLLCSTAALVMPAAAFAQSTGTVATEEEEIVVTGTRVNNGIDGIVVPDTTKAKAVLTQELIAKQSPGQTILNTINLIPNVNFTQSDAFGNAGGNIRIRGFDGNRISLTIDGIPTNDSGNYAIFSGQQIDPELIEQVNVNLGVTDVDSPTASAAGGTVNYRTLIPTDRISARVAGSLGDFDYNRFFGVIHTGRLTSFGTKAFGSMSFAQNDKFKGPGQQRKKQFNGRIYQPLGGGDFIAVTGNYNELRNNFYRNPSVTDLRNLLGATEIPLNTAITASSPLEVGDLSGAQEDLIFGFDNDPICAPLAGGPGAQRDTTTPTGSTPRCTSFFGVRFNPANTGNLRGASRFTLGDKLILTIDPSYQYVLANGGGISTLAENSGIARGSLATGRGVDFNGDGDFLDTVQFYTPNNTNTNRLGLTSSLIYEISRDHRVRVAYTFDRARHRQTGEWGYLGPNGYPASPFGGRAGVRPVLAADGFQLQQRDRLSIALLNQVAGQYIGNFFERRLRIEAGVRAPFFKRTLDQRCYTQTGSGFATCTSQPASALVIVPVTATGPFPAGSLFAPFKATYKYDKLLPNVGFTYKITDPISVFGSYAQGFSAPRTDNLYRTPNVTVQPESTNAFDLGLRYTNRMVQAQATAWKIDYANRIVTSFNEELGISEDRNVGKVESYGFDGSVAIKPVRQLSLLAFAAYTNAKLRSNIQTGAVAAGQNCDTTTPVPAGCAQTTGKRVAETPVWQWGGRANVELGPVEFGAQYKRVGDRFATDLNDVRVKGYGLLDLDARISLKPLGLEKTYFQLNVINATNEFYFGNLSTAINVAGSPNFSLGSPRTFIGTLNFGF